MIGPGKYDEAATRARQECKAAGVVLIVCDGHSGNGFSAQLSPELSYRLPAVLRQVADQIERDTPPLEPNGGNLYRPHPLMVNSGLFWRCKHGTTGFDAAADGHDTPEWGGCTKCAQEDPEAFKRWNDAGNPATL
ncbi:MAG TPA: hypothetical protein VHA37_04450 [Candidatus Saccharimonadales bacterium]|nr:hypothetical protein [Candidatus Saccharimonadales bacterium]